MKKRTITISLIVFAIALLFGIGYASWTIARGDSGVATGNFTAYTVEDDGALVVATLESENQVKFGWKDDDPSIADPWLELSDANSEEDLVAKFTVSWSGGAQSFDLTHKFYYGESETTPSALLIGTPIFALDSDVTGVSVTEAGLLAFTSAYTAYTVVTIKVTYSFGSLFNSQNPYIFFNGNEVDAKAFTGSGDSATYNGGSLTLSTINSTLGLSGTAALNANSTYADVAAAALAKLEQIVSNGESADLSMKVTATRHNA